jgi:hypothetical protein
VRAQCNFKSDLIQEHVGRSNRLCSLIWNGPHRKRRVQHFFYCCVCILARGTVYSQPLDINDGGIFIQLLPSNNRTNRHTDWWKVFIKYPIEMGSGTVIYVPSLINIASAIQNWIVGDTQMHRQQGDGISLLSFFSKC